ncbi:T9SS type B sorting domain-containing protein [Lacihabitans lacunae]|uniref:Gliding motility-associated C-terminal domain-containing protein n=1 Tax=Lacihabitans lacunae TaxID=1028214 RepID=A0ABV7YZC3_9BACT
MYRIGHIVCFLLWALTAQGQANLCTPPANSGVGGFDIVGGINEGCSPLRVEVINTSGSTNVYYDFDYRGQDLSTLKYDTLSKFPLFANTVARNYEILQYGKDASGKAIYACKTVSVRPNLQPEFSYSTCNNNLLNLIIPATSANNFDYYTIDWGDTSPIQNVSALPFSFSKSYSTSDLTRNIKVQGHNTVPNGCAPPPFKTIAMDGGGDVPKITSLETLPGGKNVKLTFTGQFDQHDIYQREVDKSYTYPNSILKSNPGSITLPIIGNKANCFMVYRNPGCIQLSGEACTISLDSIVPNGPFENIVNWESFVIGGPQLILQTSQVNSVNYKLNIQEIEPNTIFNRLKSLAVSPSPDVITKCNIKYCYQVEALFSGTWGQSPWVPYTSKVLSEVKCIDRKALKPPSIEKTWVTVEDETLIKFLYTNPVSWPVPIDSVYLYEEKNSNTALFSKAVNIPASPFFEINKNTIDDSYCFKMTFKDKCESVSQFSDLVCTVNLKENNALLNWSEELPFSSENIQSYKILETNENTGIESEISNFNSSVLSELVDLSGFDKEAKYRIKTIGDNGGESFSNSVEIPIDVLLFLPNVFTPNGDGNNDLLQIKGRFGRVKSLNFQVLNRWGEVVYRSTKFTDSWDGIINGKQASIGTYFYKAKILLTDGEELIKSGSFELIR